MKLYTPYVKFLVPLFITGSIFIGGCGSGVPTVKPFKMDIQQGNVVTSKMLLQLKAGMTKSQVRFIMGTPLVVDSFHKDRWDYFYQMRQAGKIVEQRRVILDFEKELLVKVRGDVVLQGTPGAELESKLVTEPILVQPKPVETTMWDKFKFWKKNEQPSAKTMQAEAPLVAGTTTTSDALTAPEPASMLAVPIELPDVPAVAAAIDLDEASKKPEVTAKDALKDIQSPSNKLLPAKPEILQQTPAKPAVPSSAFNKPPLEKPAPVESQLSKPLKPLPLSAKNGEQLIFRMDKTLDLERGLAVAPNKTPKPDVVSNPPEAASTANKVEPAPLPTETAPSFFDKMLEKIGF